MQRALAAIALAFFAASCAEEPRVVRVFAAVSLTAPLAEIEAAFERAHPGVDVRLNAAGSNELARQILAGARADVFFPADAVEFERVASAGLVDGALARAIAGNALVLVAAPGSDGGEGRLALADPDAVPAGRYAREWLAARGEWAALAPLVVPAANVRAAYELVRSGAVPRGIVYATELRPGDGLSIVRRQGADEAPAIRAFAGVLLASEERELAREFVADLVVAGTVFARHGFVALGER